MNNLIFCLNATMPIFLMMVLGYFFNKIGVVNDDFAKNMNSFVFKIALPTLVFKELATTPFSQIWDGEFVAFCFVVTVIQIAIAFGISIFTGKENRAEFIQASFRSSSALLGVGIAENLYGRAGMVPLMIVGAVPIYNMTAVTVLMLFHPKVRAYDKRFFIKALKGIATNPIILGIVIGFVWSILRIPTPPIFLKSCTYVANLATPLGLISLGAGLKMDDGAFEGKRIAIVVAVFMKLVGYCALFIPVALWFGYNTDKMIAVLIMLGSSTTVASFVMAKSMGHDGQVSAAVVFWTTLLSAFALTGWLYMLKVMGAI